MALSNFGELKTAIQDWCDREDDTFVNRIPDFVELAEQRIFLGGDEPLKSDPLRIRDMDATADITVTLGSTLEELDDLGALDDLPFSLDTPETNAGYGSLPSGFIDASRLYWDADPDRELEFVSRREFHTSYEAETSGTPCIYTIEGAFIIVAPGSTGTIRMLYTKRFDALSTDSDTNAIFDDAPGIYLHASLVEAFGFMRNPEAVQSHLARFISLVGGYNGTHRNSRFSGQTLQPRARSVA